MEQQKKEVIKHFNAWSSTYEREVWSRDKYFHRMTEILVMNSIQGKEKMNILELGVGPGIYLKEFIQRSHFAVGLDFSVDMLRIAKKKLEKNHCNIVNLVLADAEFLPFRDSIFDVINCIEVLRHLTKPYVTIWNIFKEMNRKLTRRGFILITMPNILFPINLFWVIYYSIPRNIMRFFHIEVGLHHNQKSSFPHFPVLYNEPEDHMYNIFFIKSLLSRTNLKISLLKGIFFFPACPKLLLKLINIIDRILGASYLSFLAYSFFIKLRRV